MSRTSSEQFIDAYWSLCREHGFQLNCIYPDLYAALPWDARSDPEDASLHIISAEEAEESWERQQRGRLKSRIESCAWWERPQDTMEDLAKWVECPDTQLLEQLVTEIRSERQKRLERARKLLADEQTQAALRGKPSPFCRIRGGETMAEYCAQAIKHPSWSGYRAMAIGAVESASPKPLPEL